MADSEVNAHAAKNAILGLNDVKKENEWIGTYTGKKVSYFNWNEKEPNNSGNEDYVVMIASGATAGKWNDVPSSYSSMNIICQAACPDGKLFDVLGFCPTVNSIFTLISIYLSRFFLVNKSIMHETQLNVFSYYDNKTNHNN